QFGNVEIPFQMWAERPNRIRIETGEGRNVLIQGWDGVDTPWVQAGRDGAVTDLSVSEQAEFKMQSEFDDPLFRPAQRGYAIDYAGEEKLDGLPAIKLLVTRNLTEQFVLYLDAETYGIIRRDDVVTGPDGEPQATQTLYGDFRPVRGVILPHRVSLFRD